jgi:hypothetical protein
MTIITRAWCTSRPNVTAQDINFVDVLGIDTPVGEVAGFVVENLSPFLLLRNAINPVMQSTRALVVEGTPDRISLNDAENDRFHAVRGASAKKSPHLGVAGKGALNRARARHRERDPRNRARQAVHLALRLKVCDPASASHQRPSKQGYGAGLIFTTACFA